jgi:protocatechuate 3,4-dioxygenase, alpha subunit
MGMTTTPSQTVGPFFSFGLNWADGPYVVPANFSGGIWIRGQVLDGAGDPVPDALIETWQADREGHFVGGNDAPWGSRLFRGFGRSSTDCEGRFGVFTVKPGRVPAGLGDMEGGAGDPRFPLQAPHMAVTVLARGLLNRVVTRIYFADEPSANAEDAVLASLPESRRATLTAAATSDGYRFDVRLQGEHETVFFAL